MKISRTQGAVACLAVWLTGATTTVPSSAWAQGAAGSAREAEAPETSSISGTNAPSALPAPRFDALRRLEEQLNQSFKRFTPKNDLEGMGNQMRPTQRPSTVNPRSDTRAKDAFDRKKNWGFLSPEEMMGVSRTDTFGSETESDGSTPGAKHSRIEQFYENLGKKGQGQESNLKSIDKSPGTTNPQKDEESLPPRLRETQDNLRKLLDSDGDGRIFHSTPERTSLSDIFGLEKTGMSPGSAEIAHRAYLNQYREVLGITAPETDASKLLAPSSSANPKTPLTTSSPLGGAFDRGTGFGQFGAVNPVLTPRAPDDVNTRTLNQWNPMYTPPRIESKTLLPPRPTFEAPRRKF